MRRSPPLKLTPWLAFVLLFVLACDAGTLLPFARTAPPPGTPFPTLGALGSPGPVPVGTPGVYRPSPAGWIAFVAQNNIWLIHPDGSGLKQITNNPRPADPSAGAGSFKLRWSADGQMLAYSQAGVLSVIDITSLSTTQLANDTAGGFDWSANGYQIVYDSSLTADSSGKPSNTGLTVVDVDTRQAKPMLASSSTYPAMIAPLWSSDFGSVIFSAPPGAAPGGMHIFDLNAGAIANLMPGSSPDTTCSWSPVVLLIACVDGAPPEGQSSSVLFLDQDGRQTNAVPLPAAHFHPRIGPWSFDGTRLAIVYSPDASGSQEMTDILSLDSGEFKILGSGAASDWSPDARWIVTGGSATQPMMVINTTSLLSSSLGDGSLPVWQPLAPDTTTVAGIATQQAFCLDTTVGFVHIKPKGHFLEFCIGSQHYKYGALELGLYAMGPNTKYFVYVSNSGWVYAARLGDPALTRLGNVKKFQAVILGYAIDPRWQIRFYPGYPNIVQIAETQFHQDQTFTLPRRITAP